MTKKELREGMLEYVVNNLTRGGHNVHIKKQDLLGQMNPVWAGTESTYLLVDETTAKGLVLLVDDAYTKHTFKALVTACQRDWKLSVLFLKDGKTFFRNSASRHNYKRNDLSLKRYTSEQTHRMILFRPEEIVQLERTNFTRYCNWLQYYQPKSARLEEGIASYQFSPVEFDYSHVSSYRFQPDNRYSERIHLWKKEAFSQGPLQLKDGVLIRASTQPQMAGQTPGSLSQEVPA